MSKFIDKDAVKALAEILNETNLTEIEYETNDQRIRLSRKNSLSQPEYIVQQPIPNVTMSHVSPAPHTSEIQQATQVIPSQHPGAIKSPMVGTLYVAAEPGAAPFVKIGDSIKEGQTLFIIEAMKVLNPIKASKAGKITQIFAEDGSPVEFGEVLAIIE